MLVMSDLSREYINRTEQSFEIPVNPMNIGCEDRSSVVPTRTKRDAPHAKTISALFPKEQRADRLKRRG
jgi:hypothetical protein